MGMVRRETGWLIAALSSLMLGLAGCGGGGGGDGGGASPPPDQGSAEVFSSDHVPLGVGDRMLWRPTTGSTAAASRAVVGTASVSGSSAYEIRDENGESEFLIKAADRLTATPGPGADTLTQAVGSVDLLRFGLRSGEAVDLFNRTVTGDFDGDGRADRATLQARMTLVGFEAYTGTLPGIQRLAQVRTELTVDLALSANGSMRVVQTSDEWYAKSIGRVRSRVRSAENGGTETVQAHELESYSVGALRSDSIPPRITQSSPAAGAATQNLAAVRIQLSERIDPTTLGGTDGLKVVDGQGSTVRSSWSMSSDGLSVSVHLATTEWPEGQYEIRLGPGVVDWANNPVQQSITFSVDRTAPTVASSQPASDAVNVGLTPTLSFTFDGNVRASGALTIEVMEAAPGSTAAVVAWPATVSGRTVTAQVTTPLKTNTLYQMQVVGTLVDEAGNAADRRQGLFGMGWPTVLFRTDTGPFARPAALVPGHSIESVLAVDINRDGRMDLVFAAQDASTGENWLGVRLAQAGGGLAAAQRLAAMPQSCDVTGLAVGDFDGNGWWDVALSCEFRVMHVLMQTASASWTLGRLGNYGGQVIDVVDLDGDGKDEILFVGEPLIGQLNSRARWQVARLGTSGNWTTVVDVPPGGELDILTLESALFVDLNRDGAKDLLWQRRDADGRTELVWMPRSGNGFGPVQAVGLPSLAANTSLRLAADVDGTAGPDLVVLDDQGLLLLGGQSGTPLGFGPARPLITPSKLIERVAVLDVDRNGTADLLYLLSNFPNRLVVRLQRNDGSFDDERSFELTNQAVRWPRSMLQIDVDGDGLLDLLIGGDVLLRRDWPSAWPASNRPGAQLKNSLADQVRRWQRRLGAGSN